MARVHRVLVRALAALSAVWVFGAFLCGSDSTREGKAEPPAKPAAEAPSQASPKDSASAPRPHILFFLADDLGWKDVGYHGSEIQTPHLDRLASAGLQLNHFYVMPLCTPTRACLMTGRYPMRLGLQSGVVRPWSRHGLPLQERTLAQALREAGYRTAIVGKWHLGHAEPAYLPTRRGFERQYGQYNGAIDYFRHERDGGLDWHRDDKGLREEGYSTHLIAREAQRIIEEHDCARPLFLYVPFNAPHAPLQVPEEYLRRYRQMADGNRRTFAAMVTCMDEAIGTILAALERKGMARDTLVIFSSDNGGPPRLGASNGTLRAGKATLYEGGVRACALAAWPGRLKAGGIIDEPLHMVDWYPTLLKLAGAKADPGSALDGRDLWPTIAEGKTTPHDEILHNVEPEGGALRRGDWKLIARGPLPCAGVESFRGKAELYDVKADPTEALDLAGQHPDKVRELLERLNAYAREAVPPRGGPKEDSPPRGFRAPAVYGE